MAKKSGAAPPGKEETKRLVALVPAGLSEWLDQDYERRKSEMVKSFGPSAARTYTMSNYIVGVLHEHRERASKAGKRSSR